MLFDIFFKLLQFKEWLRLMWQEIKILNIIKIGHEYMEIYWTVSF